MTPRQSAILAALAAGPATTEELALAAGFSGVDKHAQGYVTMTVSRLVRLHGYQIRNVFMPGSHKRALYTLVGLPGEVGRCHRCGAHLARDNRDYVCSPCARTLTAREMAEGATA
jgi:hypothetical protein